MLLNPGAPTLNQHNEHDDKQNAGSNPDDHDCVHFDFPLSQLRGLHVPQSESERATPSAESARNPARKIAEPAGGGRAIARRRQNDWASLPYLTRVRRR